ncbi:MULTISPECIES: DNA gyrase inhibitor YacG [Legionella]|uniref:DNA gyrase inhibitor YacG n=1 Tax=Legionella resiliens TaxID=2905958 RepID=A0ABS8WWL6_9GAMM|nr:MULTISPECIES: DNA gyrase inhibitor YacG [unclassified Legionella]MCE0721706.1 DNA gyrase inhibitor YacG [Legionella sp. 9fVS26]MCE3530860.1 DNA gyrase inhibitor YacG [Legionella sp. 8cVS16]QLZ70423.1 DNA gyrase inhibitor YacG [Legionella sp. PC1000]
MNIDQKITCPICRKQNTWCPENQFKPFCSQRCKLIDLGEWASDSRKIPGNPLDPDLKVAVHNGQDE